MTSSLLRRCLAEFLGTFFLVVIGCGAVVVAGLADGLTHEGIAVSWGLIVLTMIYAIGDISGCHINPAVTISFAITKRFPYAEVLPYVAVQFAGAIAGAAALYAVFGVDESGLGATTSSLPTASAFAIEFMMTLILMFVVMGVSSGAKEKSITAGLAIGSVIGMEAMVAGPVTGASMNPARSFGPALIAGDFNQLPIYLAAPVTGALAGAGLYLLIRPSVPSVDRDQDEQP